MRRHKTLSLHSKGHLSEINYAESTCSDFHSYPLKYQCEHLHLLLIPPLVYQRISQPNSTLMMRKPTRLQYVGLQALHCKVERESHIFYS